jgi:hypothetical protein
VTCTGQRLRAAIGCTVARVKLGSRELERGTGRQRATMPGFKFYWTSIPGTPGSGPGGESVGQQLRERSTSRAPGQGVASSSNNPDSVRPTVLLGGQNAEVRCGPARRRAHQYYFKFILQTAEAIERGAQARDSKGSQEPTVLNHLEMASVFCVTFSAPTRPPLPKVVETGYTVLASTTSASRQARPAAVPGAGQWNKISFHLFFWERLQSGCTGWQLLLVQGQTIWPT